MKLFKRLSVLGLLALLGFAFVGCGEYSVLDTLNNVTASVSSASQTMSDFDESVMNYDVQAMSYNPQNQQIMFLSDTEDNVRTDLQTFIELRKEVIALHADIMTERTDILASRIQIKDAVSYIKTNQIMLLEDDKATIQNTITDLRTLRDDLLATKGEAYQRLIDLKGSYTRDNLPEINQVYSEVITVLQARLVMFQQANDDFSLILNLLNDYTE